MKPIFISGPHGCGKTTLINKLLKDQINFVLDDYKIDFVNDLASISIMTVYEECLLRIYHRFYTAEQAILKCKNTSDNKILVVDRSIYDSLVYNKVEYILGKITKSQYDNLTEIADNGLKVIKPYTVILNPNPDIVVDYLEKRQVSGTRKDRDKLCAREDTHEYINMMNAEYVKLYTEENVLVIDNKEIDGMNKVYKWISAEVLL
ncbi:AAA family ATPase [Anaerocolumna xylanovorans]|uniref:Thymidylate kinase n=1 Tax=Anaerocolumna xylanovorans DSM 12503 TaxID=1121345 RepID=A0A1M7XWY9_9FIRM|nr:AAA family ATPase [Anaerocolumna xylanovorans]SHO43123.1 Thymidylate kinase [Anaerocolumna xylanovorans DSM 12503]